MEKEEKKIPKKEEVKEEVKEVGKQKALITSRILFISVLDKIYIIVLLLSFISATYVNFAGDISSINYGFWARVGYEILIIIIMFIYYLILNWFYKCAVKTMLCLTKNEVYMESYVPFKRTETSIPLNKITKVTTFKLFWIFRWIVIHQYHSFPVVFFTWNNQEFKDKLNELITNDKEKVENIYQDKNIIGMDKVKYLKYLGIALAGIIVIIGVVKLFNFIFSSERKVAGTYAYESREIILDSNGSCNIDDIEDDVTECTWSYNKDNERVSISYEYTYYSYYYGSSTLTDSISLKYDGKEKTLEYQGNIYKK